jgi:hypothetical protein
MRIKFTSEDIESLNNAPRRVYVPLGYWLFTRDRVGRLIAELWSNNSEDHPQDTYRGSNEPMGFYPHFKKELSGIPSILYITGKRVRQYSLYLAKVKELCRLDEIYTEIKPVYPGWEVDKPRNRVHSEIFKINKLGELKTINTAKYVGQYYINCRDAEVLVVDYTNTGKGTSKLCVYTRSEECLKKHGEKVRYVLKFIKNRKEV